MKKGITLIALIITIIVLLILAGVSVALMVGENGILNKATQAKEKTAVAQENELIRLAYSAVKLDEVSGSLTSNSFENELKNLAGENNVEVITNGPNDYIIVFTESKNKYQIVDGIINEIHGLQDRQIVVTEVKEEYPKYEFNNTINQYEIDDEAGTSNAQYTVLGVSTEENGTYVTSGTITGNSGTLEIKNLSTGNYEYTLTNCLQSDDIFYVKIRIGNNLEKIQRITIVQGDVVKYEECFAGITYSGDGWQNITGSQYSEGKAIKATFVQGTETEKIELNVYGKKYKFATVSAPNSATIACTINRRNGGSIKGKIVSLINQESDEIKQVIIGENDELEVDTADYYTPTIIVAGSAANLGGIEFIFDAIWIYK